MKRKLFAMLLCGLAIILLMGAGMDPMIQAVQAADRAQEERIDAYAQEPANQIEDQPQNEQATPNQPEVELDRILLVNGQPVPKSVGRMTVGGETYVSLKAMAEQLDPNIAVEWNADKRIVTLTTETLSLRAQTGKLYIEANGRYLYMPEGVQLIDGVMMVSLDALAKAFDATTGWDTENGTFTVTTGSGAIGGSCVGIGVTGLHKVVNQIAQIGNVIHAVGGNGIAAGGEPTDGGAVALLDLIQVGSDEFTPYFEMLRIFAFLYFV